MSATDTTTHADAEDEAVPGPKRLRPNQIAIIVGVAIAVVVAVSGVAAAVFQFHDDSEIQREVFGNIPGPLKLAFYTVIPVMFVYGAIMFSHRMKQLAAGCSGQARHHPEERQEAPREPARRALHADPAARSGGRDHALADLLRVPDPARGHHRCSRSTTSCPSRSSSSTAPSTRPTRSSATPAGLIFTVGVVWAIVRRYVQRPYRIRIKSKPEHALILGDAAGARRHRLPRRDVPHRGRRPPGLREVVVHRLPAVGARREHRAASPGGTRRCGSCTW